VPYTDDGNGNLLPSFTTTQQPNISIEAYKYHTAFCLGGYINVLINFISLPSWQVTVYLEYMRRKTDVSEECLKKT